MTAQKQFPTVSMSQADIEKIPQNKRTKCIIYTRVMGYHCPVERFNKGKRGEFEERKWFEESLTQSCCSKQGE